MEDSKIKVVFVDCDGTLTNGIFYTSPSGEVMKGFNTRDFYALYRLRSLGIQTYIITGSVDGAADAKARAVGMECISGVNNKDEYIDALVSTGEFDWSEIVFIGDGENDIRSMRKAGFSACPNNAVIEAQDAADYISSYNGGEGAVADTVRFLLSSMNEDWLIDNYK